MKRIAIIIITAIILATAVNVYAGIYSEGVIYGGKLPVDNGISDNVTFFLSCDSKSDAEKANGSATVSWGSALLIDTTNEVVGNGCVDQNNDDYNNLYYEVNNNFDYTNSRIGFWVRLKSYSSETGKLIATTGTYKAPNGFNLYFRDNSSTITCYYLNGNASEYSVTLSLDTWYYFELAFSATSFDLYIDGSKVLTCTAGDGDFTDTDIHHMSIDGYVVDHLQDNIVIVNDNTINLYEHRYETFS